MYRRLSVRQQQLFARAAAINPEYYGVCAVAPLSNGAVDLKDLGDPVYRADSLSRIEIADKGTSGYANGDEVHVVALTDPDAALPPRVTVRNGVVAQVGTDLNGVVSLRVFYSRLPLSIGPNDGSKELELLDPFQELLVVDLARYLVEHTLGLDATLRGQALPLLEAEEKDLLALFDAHVKAYTAAAETGRFGRTIGPTYQ